MEYRTLGNTDLVVSSIGLGCVTFGREIDAPAAFQVLDRAVERGITLLDTAEAYAAGASERVVGEWLATRRLRDRIVLATKVAGQLTRQRIVSSAEDSLRRLQTDAIDLFQLHHWDDATPLEETLAGLDDLLRAGKARYTGCSNWSAGQLSQALRSAPGAAIRSVQSPYNLVQREIEGELLPMCRKQRIGVIGYSPLGAGFLTGKYRRGHAVPRGTRFDVIPGHQPIYFTGHGFAVLDRLERAAAAADRPMTLVALAWALRQPGPTSVLIGARSIAHVDQAFDALQFEFDECLLQL